MHKNSGKAQRWEVESQSKNEPSEQSENNIVDGRYLSHKWHFFGNVSGTRSESSDHDTK